MDLWIRSQDKEELTKVVCVCLDGESSIIANFEKYYNGCNYTKIGTYKSKEIALEVLDEIQNNILNLGETVLNYGKEYKEYGRVYEMPKE